MLPLAWPHARRIRDGVIAFAETAGWLLVDSGSADMESKAHLLADADGLICTAGPGNAWIPRLAAGGLPVVNCNEHLSDTPGVISVSVDWSDLFDHALGHFQKIGRAHV